MKFKSDIEVQAGLKDSSGSVGASGQILSSTSGNVSWVTPTVNTVARDVQNTVKAGVAITKGQAVYVTGADGTNIIVGLASNTSEATSSKTLGLLNATVSTNGFADVVQIGRLSGLNTIGAVVGDPVWLGTNGNLIYGLTNKPYAPAHLVFIGVVTRVNANNGEIFITVQNGFELNEIHDVDLKTTVPVNGDILGYNGTLWVNKTIAGWLGYTPQNAATAITTSNIGSQSVNYANTAGSAGSVDFNNLTNKTGGTGTYQTSGDFRAPIFYDSNNTAYYVNPAANSNLSNTYIDGHYYGSNNTSNILIRSAANTSEMGILGQNSSGAFKFQLYGNGSSYGFLNAAWSSWDLRKDVNANLYLNNQTTYYYGTDTAYLLRAYGTADMRAPIFYDLDNTAYYVNPNGTSSLSLVIADNTIKSRKAQADGDYTTAAIWTESYSTTTTGIAFHISGTVGKFLEMRTNGILYWEGNKVITQDGGTWSINVSGTAGSLLSYQSNWASTSTPTNVVGLLGWKNYGNGHVIFDASASTTPSGTSCSNTNPQNNWTGTFPTLMGWNGTNTYGVRVDSARVADSATSAGSVDFNNLTNKASGTGTYQTSGDFRAPIFYDSNNTAYYLNPNAGSNIYDLIISGASNKYLSIDPGNGYEAMVRYTGGTGDSWYVGKRTSPELVGTDGFHFYSEYYSETVAGVDVVGNIYALSSMRAPAFYDRDNTSYYLDPSATSNLVGLTVANTITGNISGGSSYASNLSGAINASTSGISSMKYNDTRYWITDPNAPGSYFQALTMGNGNDFTQIGVNSSNQMYYRFNGTGSTWYNVLSSNNYSSYAVPLTRTITINGVSQDLSANRSWTVTAVETDTLQTVTSRGATTNLAITAPNYVFSGGSSGAIGLVTSTSSFGIRSGDGTTYGYGISTNNSGGLDIMANQSGQSIRFWCGTTNVTPIQRMIITNGDVTASDSLRAPIFYDSNNTGYYLDPNNTSNLNVVRAANSLTGAWIGVENTNSATGNGISLYNGAGSGQPTYGLMFAGTGTFGTHGSVTGDWATYFTMNSGATTRGWIFKTGSTNVASISGSGILQTDGYIYSNSYIQAGQSMYSPIYYDSNDSTYYLDPTNTTTALNVAGKVQVNYGASSGTLILQATGTYGTMSLNTYYGVFHTSGDFYIGLPASSGNNLYGNQARFASFIDRNNSAYYLTPSSGSNLNTGNLVGRWKYTDYLVSNNTGGLMGDYNVSGTATKCIWTIGESWPLGNMYGLAYEYVAGYGHHLALKNNGSTYARLAFAGEGALFTGTVSSSTGMSSPIYYDANDSSYYFDGSDTGDSIRVAGDIVAYYSDERLKDRKGNIKNALEKVLSLNGFYYEPNETAQALGYKKKLEVGVSAQEVQAILPEIIKDAPIGGDYKTLDYGRLTPLLIEAIKEQQKQIEELKELVNKLINK